MLDVHLKGCAGAQVRAYLSENDLEMRFSAKHKLYYSGLRPVIPAGGRQWLQRRLNRRKSCRANFIWEDFVDLVRRDEAVREIDPNLPASDFRTVDQVVAESVSQPRFYMMLLTLFAAVALTLAACASSAAALITGVKSTRSSSATPWRS